MELVVIVVVVIIAYSILIPIGLVGGAWWDYTKPDRVERKERKRREGERKRPMRSVYYTLERLNGKNVSKKYYEKEEQAIRDSERCRRSMIVPRKEPLNIVRRTEEIVKVVTE